MILLIQGKISEILLAILNFLMNRIILEKNILMINKQISEILLVILNFLMKLKNIEKFLMIIKLTNIKMVKSIKIHLKI